MRQLFLEDISNFVFLIDLFTSVCLWFVFTKGYHPKQTSMTMISPSDLTCLFTSTSFHSSSPFSSSSNKWHGSWLAQCGAQACFLMPLYRHYSFLYSITFNHSHLHHVMWTRKGGLAMGGVLCWAWVEYVWALIISQGFWEQVLFLFLIDIAVNYQTELPTAYCFMKVHCSHFWLPTLWISGCWGDGVRTKLNHPILHADCSKDGCSAALFGT